MSCLLTPTTTSIYRTVSLNTPGQATWSTVQVLQYRFLKHCTRENLLSKKGVEHQNSSLLELFNHSVWDQVERIIWRYIGTKEELLLVSLQKRTSTACFFLFMNRAWIQGSTNSLHENICETFSGKSRAFPIFVSTNCWNQGKTLLKGNW